jgi:oxygen-independent coproporphyrinogen-3 oxidase
MQRPSPGSVEELIAQLSQPVDLYLHFPFCRVMGRYECSFCHFYKVIHDSDAESRYLDACMEEIRMYKRRLGRIRVRSVYFGGGTFSLISPENLRRLLSWLWTELDIDPDAEVKFEIHADASRTPQLLAGVLAVLRQYPITHLVLDIQTLHEDSLRMVSWGRVRPDDYFATLDLCRELGFERFVTALILGLPLETMESFLRGVLALATLPHVVTINIFPLMMKQGDAVRDQFLRVPEIFPSVRDRDVTHHAARILLRGLGFSESPLYFMNRGGTVPDQQTRKFEGRSLLGIGPSAFGTFRGRRKAQYYNVPSLGAYLRRIGAGALPIWRAGEMAGGGWLRRRIILEFLNLNRHFDLAELDGLDAAAGDLMEFYREAGLLQLHSGSLSLTGAGLLRAEEMSFFMAEQEVLEALRTCDATRKLDRFNYFITRTPRQEALFHEALRMFQDRRVAESAVAGGAAC